MSKQQSGFTLIELVMVIVILGILAAVAVPKFFDMTTDAQNAAKSGARSSVATAVSIATAVAKRSPSGNEVIGQLPGTTCATGIVTVPGSGTATVTVQLLTNATPAVNAADCTTTNIGGVGTATYVP